MPIFTKKPRINLRHLTDSEESVILNCVKKSLKYYEYHKPQSLAEIAERQKIIKKLSSRVD